MKKKSYKNLEINVVLFEAKDVIVASNMAPVGYKYNMGRNEMIVDTNTDLFN